MKIPKAKQLTGFSSGLCDLVGIDGRCGSRVGMSQLRGSGYEVNPIGGHGATDSAKELDKAIVTAFHWKILGKSISDAINTWFDEIDWGKAGKALSAGVKGFLTILRTAVKTTKWDEAGKIFRYRRLTFLSLHTII